MIDVACVSVGGVSARSRVSYQVARHVLHLKSIFPTRQLGSPEGLQGAVWRFSRGCLRIVWGVHVAMGLGAYL